MKISLNGRGAGKHGRRERKEISVKGRKGGDVIRMGGAIRVPGLLFLSVPLREERAERAVRAPRPPHHTKKIFDILSRDPPVPERAQPWEIPLVPSLEEGRRGGPERREDSRDRSLNGRDAPEGERGGQERDDLAVGRVRVPVREEEGVRVEPPRPPLAPQGFEALAQESEVRGAGRASHASTLAFSR